MSIVSTTGPSEPTGRPRPSGGEHPLRAAFDEALDDAQTKHTPPRRYAFNDQPWQPETSKPSAAPKANGPKTGGSRIPSARGQGAWPALLGVLGIKDPWDGLRADPAVTEAIERFGLNPNSKRHLTAARAYVEAKRFGALLFEGVSSGDVEKLERAAQAVMRNELAHPGTLRSAYPSLIPASEHRAPYLPATEPPKRVADGGNPQDKARLDRVVETAIKEEPPDKPESGFAFVTHNEEEANLVTSMRAQGKNSQEIWIALDALRASRGNGTDLKSLIDGLPSNDATVDSAGLNRLLASLPKLATGSTDSLRAYASGVLGLPEHAIDFQRVTSGLSKGHKGKSGAPVYLVRGANGELLAALKQFPAGQIEEMGGELLALQMLKQLDLQRVHSVEVLGAAGLSDGGGVLVYSPAKGVAVDDLMLAVHNAKPGVAQDDAMGRLREAVRKTGGALAEFHTRPPGSGVSEVVDLDSHLRASISIAGEITERIEKLKSEDIEVKLDSKEMENRIAVLVDQARRNPGLASLVHGDFHPGNIFFDAESGIITFIDTPRLPQSVNTTGAPIGAAARDFTAFHHKLTTFGAEYELSDTAIAELQSEFENAYVDGGGIISSESEQFFRARVALGVYLDALKQGLTEKALERQTVIFKDALNLQ